MPPSRSRSTAPPPDRSASSSPARSASWCVAGTLARGDRLPSSRALAADLGVSRSVTEQAYEQLLAEGWLEARRGSGTFVAAGGAASTATPRRPTPTPAPDLVRLDAGTPWIDPRHAAGWRRAWREVSTARRRGGTTTRAGCPSCAPRSPTGSAATRGLAVDPDEVLVTERHHRRAPAPALRAAARPGRPRGPGLPGRGRDRARGRRARCATCPRWRRSTDLTGVAAAYVTPAHQHPLGRVMPAADRLALLDAARSADAVVVEDDYDSEFRYDVAPVPALASLDRAAGRLPRHRRQVGRARRCGWAGWSRRRPTSTRSTRAGRSPTRARRGRCSARSSPCCATATSTRWCAPRAGCTPSARPGSRPRSRRTPSWRGRSPACTRPGCSPSPTRSGRGRPRARPGFEVNLLADYCRTARLTGLVLGFGGVTDDELDRALAAVHVSPLTEPSAGRSRRTPRRPRPARARSCGRGSTRMPHSSAKMPPSTNISGITKPRPIAATWTTQPSA